MSIVRTLVISCVIVSLLIADRAAHAQGREGQRAEVRGVIKAVDFAAPTITLAASEGRGGPTPEKTYPLGKSVELAVGSRGGVFREGQLADLTTGTSVVLSLAADQNTVDSIVAEGPSVRGVCKAIDAATNTITISPQFQQRGEAAPDQSFTIPADAEIAIDDGRGRRFSIKEGKLADLVPGTFITAQLSIDRKQAHSILAEGPLLSGVIKSVDAAANSITLVMRAPRGNDAGEERILAVTPETGVLLDDGRGRRLSVKAGQLADIATGSSANVRLSANGATAAMIRVEGPTVMGLLKGVDPTAKTITLAFPRGRGEAPEEKSFSLAADTRIMLEWADVALDALKPSDNGPYAIVRLSLDQKSVQSVNARQPMAR